jgi:REP element-mobilizing transposase RayT
MNRGDRREAIFHDDADRRRFLETLGQACAKTEWLVLAYCLMGNHFHLVIETPLGNLVEGMKWFLGTYTSRFNRRHKLSGHLFSGRYKSLIVDGSGNGYLKTVCDYVHLNPVRAKLLRPEEKLREYDWSSYFQYLMPAGRRPPWLRVERLLGEMHIPKDSSAGRRQFERKMEERRAEASTEEWKVVRRGWYVGDEPFRKELLEAAQAQVGPSHYGVERQETGEQKALRIIGEELKRRGWTEARLSQLRKGDARKVQIARRLRAETTVTLHWIAASLAMGTWTHVANLLSAASLAT